MRRKLSRDVIAKARPKQSGLAFLWDTDQRGLGVQVTSAGTKSFVFSYSLAGWRSPRRVTLGQTDALTLEKARARAREMREQVSLGQDPGAILEEVKAKPTVRDLSARFLADHVDLKLKLTTRRSYHQLLKTLPARFRGMRVDEVTGDDIARLHVSMKNKPYLANRTLAVLRKMFGLAERWNMRPRGSNPAAGHDPYPERKDRGARLSDEELARVGQALTELDAEGRFGPLAIALLRLNMLTGWRPIEVKQLRWEEVDLDRRVVTLREAKTGTRSGFLGRPAAEVLARLPRIVESPYCFPGRIPGRPVAETRRLWEALHQRAGLPGSIRPYDLVRHTYNTVAQEAGVPPEMVQVLVGHVPTSISARYTHFALARTLEAADLAAEAIDARLRGVVDE